MAPLFYSIKVGCYVANKHLENKNEITVHVSHLNHPYLTIFFMLIEIVEEANSFSVQTLIVDTQTNPTELSHYILAMLYWNLGLVSNESFVDMVGAEKPRRLDNVDAHYFAPHVVVLFIVVRQKGSSHKVGTRQLLLDRIEEVLNVDVLNVSRNETSDNDTFPEKATLVSNNIK